MTSIVCVGHKVLLVREVDGFHGHTVREDGGLEGLAITVGPNAECREIDQQSQMNSNHKSQ